MDETLRQLVRSRAALRCEYCHLPEAMTEAPFQIDHIIAIKHRGETHSENLAWSCFYCNSFKGPNLSGWDDVDKSVTRLFHPRTDEWGLHFVWRGARLVGLTPIGRVTIDVLAINDPEAVEFRKLLLELGVSL
ncbi:MAG: HNH endonuclease [Candidatus Saccharimonas sp.]|nr:HNH endonuclease [Planctomycetaceae bacterium]